MFTLLCYSWQEVDKYLDIDPVPIQLSKTISVSEPSLLFPLHQSTVAVHTTSTDVSGYYSLQPVVCNHLVMHHYSLM